METSGKEEAPVFLDRSSRASRGKRMTKLLGEEIEEDELFWNQDALKEEEDDDNYEEEPEVVDEFDSDFDDDESEPDEEGEDEGVERVQKKKLIFPGKKLPKKKKKKVLSNLETATEDDRATQQSTAEELHDVPDDAGERMIRKSTRTSVIVRQAERDAIRAALQATMKPIKRKKEGEEKKMTQEEMLLEAAQTEIMNLRNLERVLAREEEVKRRAIVHKAVYNGPQIRYISKDGFSYLEFSKGLSFQSEISTTPVPYPEKSVCAITGLPAKGFNKEGKVLLGYGVVALLWCLWLNEMLAVYVLACAPGYHDPKTGLPYATLEAFKIIRQRFSDENAGTRKEMNMGCLYDSVSGKGFSVKQKRSRMPNKNGDSSFRHSACFRRFLVPEDEVSD